MIVPIILRQTNKNTIMSVLKNLKDLVRLQCNRCGREWMYHGKNPYRTRCT
jgi:hypothetical protein